MIRYIRKFLLLNFLILGFNAISQTLLIDPTAEGGFELPGGLVGNGWTTVNSTINNWYSSGAAIPYSGSNSAFISNSSGVNYGYDITSFQTSHFYRDITVPAGQTSINLKFQYKSISEPFFDRLLVYVASTTLTPVAGIPASSDPVLTDATLIYEDTANVANYQLVNLFLSPSLAGTTFRLIFTWQNDDSGGNNLAPASVDDVSLFSTSPSALNGTYTINNAVVTSTNLPVSGGNFNSFTDAVNYLNINGIAGPVTFNVTSGQTFFESPQIITATGTSLFPIVFQKSGSGANPKFIGTYGNGGSDACFTLKGSDYITFDGIDAESNISSSGGNQKMEYGYYLLPISATNGTKKINIKNCKIMLDRTNTISFGILQSVNTGTPPSSKFGTNSGNTFDNVSIENSFQGIWLNGNATYFDDSCQIKNCNIGGNTPFDIGGGNTSNTCSGIWIANQKNCKVFNNTIKNVVTQFVVHGIFVDAGYGVCEIYNNKISAIKNNGNNLQIVNGIRANVPSAAAGAQVIRIYNNFISDITSAYSGSAIFTRVIRGINLQTAGGGNTSSVIEVTHNSVNIDGSSSPNCSSTCFEVGTTSGPIYKVRSNIFANTTGAQSSTAKHYCWRSTSTTSIGNTGSVSDNNNLYIANTTNGFVGNGGTSAGTDYTFATWKSSYNQDANSISVDPIFNSATDLHVLNPDLNSVAASASLTPYITTDIDGQTRTQPSDIGADEFTPLNFDLKPLSFVNPSTTGCYSSVQPVSVIIKNNTGFPIDFSVTPANVVVKTTGAFTQSISLSLNTGSINAFSTTTVSVGNANMSAYGTYSFNCYALLAQDQNNLNDTIYNTIRVNVAPASLPQMVDFTNFTGVNLNTLFPGWSVASGSSPTGTVSLWAATSSFSPNVNARITMNSTTKQEWIVSPKISPNLNTTISFKAAITSVGNNGLGTMGSDDNLQLMISTDCGNSYQILNTLNSSSGLTNSFSQFFYQLGSYAGQEIILAFYAVEGGVANNYDLHLEDINISNASVYDLSVKSLVEPQQKNCYVGLENFVVNLKNEGPTAFNFSSENVTLIGKLNGANTYSLILNSGIINAGATQTYTLANNLNLQPVDIYRFMAYASFSLGDANTANDTLKKTIFTQNPSVSFSLPSLNVCENDSVLINSIVTINGLTTGTVTPLNNTDGPFLIPDNNLAGITSTIQVTGIGGFASQVLEVRIDSLLHTYDGDLVITLIAPDNSSIPLSVNNGATGDNYIGTVFSNSSLNSILNGIPAFTGTYSPQQSFDALTGLANGVWKLNIKDVSSQELGTFYRWSLVFKSPNTLSSFSWTPSSDLSSSNSLNPKASPTSNTQYTLTITDVNGCAASAVQTISVNSIPTITLGNDTAFCQGNSIVLDAGSGFNTYSWNGGLSSSQQYTVNQQGNYSVVVTNTNSCSSSDTIFVTVNQNPSISLVSSTDSICSNGQSITFTASPTGGVYSGNGINQLGVFNPLLVSIGTNKIYYELTNSNGCYAKDSSFIEVLQKPTVTLTLATSTICSNSPTITLSGGLPAGGVYSGNGVTLGSAFNPAVSGVGSQTITYSFTDQYGCSDNSTDALLVDVCNGIVTIPNSQVIIYPNPANELIHLNNVPFNSRICILDVTGKEILKFNNSEFDITLNISELTAGIYVIRIDQYSENKVFNFKMIKNN